jgi:hypothetical protein
MSIIPRPRAKKEVPDFLSSDDEKPPAPPKKEPPLIVKEDLPPPMTDLEYMTEFAEMERLRAIIRNAHNDNVATDRRESGIFEMLMSLVGLGAQIADPQERWMRAARRMKRKADGLLGQCVKKFLFE